MEEVESKQLPPAAPTIAAKENYLQGVALGSGVRPYYYRVTGDVICTLFALKAEWLEKMAAHWSSRSKKRSSLRQE